MPIPIDFQNNRGRFRNMEMDFIRSIAHLSLWHDGEQSAGLYRLPFRACPILDGWLSLSWIRLAKNFKLVEGIPVNVPYRLRNFVCLPSPDSHIGPFVNAIDFVVPPKTSVLAARSGKIIEAVEDNDRWGDGAEFRDKLNYLTIEHAEGEFSQYCHLWKGSIAARGLRVGSMVAEGQVIAKSGRSGWMDRDHLHFIVFRNDNKNANNPLPGNKFKSLVVRFR